MSGDLRVSMLFQANAAQAKAEVAGMRAEVEALAKGAASAAQTAGAAAPEIGEIGDAARLVAQDLIIAAQAQAEWDAQVQMVRASIQPMVGEMVGLQNAIQQVAVYEQMGALSANEAAQAHDVLSRQVIDLMGRMDAAGVTIDGTTAAMARQETNAQELINRLTGVSNATEATISDTLRHGMALDDLRARYNPLFAASRQYEVELRNIAEAERLGAISAMEATAARQRASQVLDPIPGQLNRMGASSQAAAAQVGQLGFQLNDIIMMMSLGQSPFMLMMQQGPQVTQVFDGLRKSGMAIGPTLAGAFLNMLNPVSLATLAVIGFGTAAVQWLTDTGEAAETAEDAISRLADIQGRLDKANGILSMSVSELIEKYGSYAGRVRDVAKSLHELAVAEAQAALKKGITEAADEWDRYAAKMEAAQAKASYLDLQGAAAQGLQISRFLDAEETLAAVGAIQEELKVTEDDAIRLANAFARVAEATSFEDRVAALADLNALIQTAGVSLADLPEPIRQALIQAGELNIEMAALATSAEDGHAAMVALLNAAPGAGWLAGAIGDAGTLEAALWNAATAASSIQFGVSVPTIKGAAQGIYDFFTGGSASAPDNSPRPRPAPPMLNEPALPKATGGRGGGGGGAAKEETSALQKLIEEQNRQIDALRTIDPLQAEIAKNHEALKDATEGETKAVSDLIAERMHLEEIRDRLDEIEQSGKSAFTGLVTGALTFADAISNVLMNLAEMAASDAWDLLWGGGAGGGLGLGGIISGWLGLGPKTAASADLGATASRTIGKIGASAPSSWTEASAGRRAASGATGGGQGGEVAVRVYFDSRKADWTAEIERVSGAVATDRVMEGISMFSSHVLPGRMAEIDQNPRVVG